MANITITQHEEDIADRIADYSKKEYSTKSEVKELVLSALKSYRWHVIERASQIGNAAVQEANKENLL